MVGCDATHQSPTPTQVEYLPLTTSEVALPEAGQFPIYYTSIPTYLSIAAKLLDEFWILVLEISSLNHASFTRTATTTEHQVLARKL